MGSVTTIAEQGSRKQEMLEAISSRRHFSNHRALEHHVARSWERCLLDYKLDPDKQREPQQVSRYELEQRREKNVDFLSIAATEVSNLYQQISGSGSAILLADKDGVIMNVVGDSRFLEKTRGAGFLEGVIWSERSCGTNGLGTCLAERSPVLVHHNDHFFPNYSNLSCAAAPIFDYRGELLGVLDASSDSPLAQQYSVALVKMSAQMIENRVFLSSCAPHYLVRFHSRLEFVGALGEGVIAFDADGRVKAMNGTAQFQFDEDWQHDISQATIDDFFDVSIPQMMHIAHRQKHSIAQMRCARSGRSFYASLQAPLHGNIGPDLYLSHTTKSSLPKLGENRPNNLPDKIDLGLALDCFEFGDSDIKNAINVASKTVSLRAAPLLICGRTGSGKSSLALSLHNKYIGPELPFTRINCASLQPHNVEQQLFGNNGDLLKGGGGCLFLDEIGDMPTDVQPAFLHVLERHVKEPPSDKNSFSQQLQIISATQRDLAEAVSEGIFRSDLYYRVCGVQIDIKPLGERNDTPALISNIYKLNSGDSADISEECLEMLTRAQWPGNIRQLLSVIVRARLIADDATPQARHFAQALAQQPKIEGVVSTAPQTADIDAALTPLETAEKKTLLDALSDNNWSVSDVAKLLGLSRNTIYRKMSKYSLPAKRLTNKEQPNPPH